VLEAYERVARAERIVTLWADLAVLAGCLEQAGRRIGRVRCNCVCGDRAARLSAAAAIGSSRSMLNT